MATVPITVFGVGEATPCGAAAREHDGAEQRGGDESGRRTGRDSNEPLRPRAREPADWRR